jgi:hypothetical protein
MEFNTRDLNGPWRITQMIVVDEGRSKSIWLAVSHARMVKKTEVHEKSRILASERRHERGGARGNPGRRPTQVSRRNSHHAAAVLDAGHLIVRQP